MSADQPYPEERSVLSSVSQKKLPETDSHYKPKKSSEETTRAETISAPRREAPETEVSRKPSQNAKTSLICGVCGDVVYEAGPVTEKNCMCSIISQEFPELYRWIPKVMRWQAIKNSGKR